MFDCPLAEQSAAGSRSDGIDIVIARSRVRVEVPVPSTRWNNIIKRLVEPFGRQWLAQLEWMIPCDRIQFWALIRERDGRNCCAARSCRYMIQIRPHLRIFTLERICQSACQGPIRRPGCDRFLFCADRLSGYLGHMIRSTLLLFWFYMVIKISLWFLLYISFTGEQDIRATIGCRTFRESRKSTQKGNSMHSSRTAELSRIAAFSCKTISLQKIMFLVLIFCQACSKYQWNHGR
jgi:hypothetical protein